MRQALLALLVAMALPAAACTSVTDGTAVKASGGHGPGISADQLDVGGFPTTPREALGVTGDPRIGLIVEAQRLADHVIGPWEVDPELTESFGFGAAVLPGPQAMMLVGPPELVAVAGRHDLINGFASGRAHGTSKLLLSAVLRFPDEASAKAAADEFGQAVLKQPGLDGPAQKVAVPGHPEIQAGSYAAQNRQSGRFYAVRAFTAHGPYVFMQQSQVNASADAALQLIVKTVELQTPEIERFRATDLSEFTDISLDPTGLLARTIPADAQAASPTTNATYEPRGALHFQSDPTRSAKLFSDTGIDTVAMGKTNVYETKDGDGATRVVDDFLGEVAPTAKPATEVRNLPGSHCLGMPEGGFYCLASADRYAIETSAPTLLAAQQMTAAQYVMLMTG